MRTLAALAFIAGAAVLAVVLIRMPTVADGRVVAADRLAESRKDGVTAMACDPHIPIGLTGAAFTCLATLADGATQVVEYTLRPDGDLEVKPQPPVRAPGPRPAPGHRSAPGPEPRNFAPRDPWAERP